MRALGEVVRGVLFAGALAGATGALLVGASAVSANADPRLQPLLHLASIVAFLVLLVPGQAWLRAAIERAVFRRSGHRRDELRDFLRTLAPEVGTRECCRRALAELARVMRFRGAALLLDDGSSVRHGELALGTLERVWPRGAAAASLPDASLADYALREVPDPLREALSEADVVAIVPVRSPRGRWGHLFMTGGFLSAPFSDEDTHTVESFATQLALVLDGAELLARALAVERSLAHAGKLAALGELAARIAHEIRNPVTAARSLAQQLAVERGPAAEPSQLILTELDRVERQVAALLRFARRDEFRFEPVDVGRLARTTVAGFGSRLDAAGIHAALDLADGVSARADGEKLRQVLVNLLENAIDALTGAADPRRLEVSVAGVNGAAILQVRDSGPALPAEVLAHVFEPFFTSKEHGTGLGLAIARRTVEAHGGTIEAGCGADGTTFRVTLPLGGPP